MPPPSQATIGQGFAPLAVFVGAAGATSRLTFAQMDRILTMHDGVTVEDGSAIEDEGVTKDEAAVEDEVAIWNETAMKLEEA